MKRLEKFVKPGCEKGSRKRFSLLIVAWSLLLFLISNIELTLGNAEDHPARTPEKSRFVPGEILIKFKEDADIGAIAEELSRRKETFRTVTKTSTLDTLNDRFRVKKMERLIRSKEERNLKGLILNQETASEIRESAKKRFLKQVDSARQKFPMRSNRIPEGVEIPYLNHIYRVEFEEEVDVREASRAYAEDPDVEYAEPNYLAYMSYTPSDPLFLEQWAHQNTEAEPGWDIQRGSNGITIAVIDTGVAYDHEDLANNMLGDCSGGCPQGTGYDFVDIDTESYVNDGYELIPGEDYTDIDDDPSDYNGHGSHVAGIAAGAGDNGVGISGVCMDCRIMPLRVAFSILEDGEECGSSENDDIANALIYAADNGADVINMSYGGEKSRVESDAIDYAYSMGVVLVGAAGNENTDSLIDSYPAAYDHVIAVAATAGDDSKTFYSNYGDWVDVAAPGGDHSIDDTILSTVPLAGGIMAHPSGYRFLQGTSMATAYVAGLAGLVLSSDGGLSSEEVRDAIRAGVDPIHSTYSIGTGRVNNRKIMESFSITLSAPDNVTEGDGRLFGQGSVCLASAHVEDFDVSLTSSDPSEVTVPSIVTVAAGQTSSAFDLFVVDDNLVDGAQEVVILCSADGYRSAQALVLVNDNESTDFIVEIIGTAREGDGVLVNGGSVSIAGMFSSDIVVDLFSNDAKEVTVPLNITIPSGQTTVTFDMTVIDDSVIDGTKTVTISASAEGWTLGSDTITIQDNDSNSGGCFIEMLKNGK
ncbi:MAG: S8 family serine peptidase [Deltaproteobacteria bacterium]|nr:S8 family serine peptidase [Deltaproteobacteria bacterium]